MGACSRTYLNMVECECLENAKSSFLNELMAIVPDHKVANTRNDGYVVKYDDIPQIRQHRKPKLEENQINLYKR